MKRIITMLITLVILTGCAAEKPQTTPVPTPEPPVEVTAESTEVPVTDALRPAASEYAPDPYELYTDDFSYYSILETPEQISFMLRGLDKEAYLLMRQACREKGFTHVTSQTDIIYRADSEDGKLRLELGFLGGEDDASISVCIYYKEADGK